MTDAAGAAVDLRDISVVFDGKLALDGLDWRVDAGERWVVLGPNGSGKTTLVRIVSLYLHPSRGVVCVLGAVLGRVDIRKVRPRIGIASASMAAMLRRELEVIDVVMTSAERRARAVVAHLHRRRPSSCAHHARPVRHARVRGTHVRDALEWRAAEGAARRAR